MPYKPTPRLQAGRVKIVGKEGPAVADQVYFLKDRWDMQQQERRSRQAHCSSPLHPLITDTQVPGEGATSTLAPL